MKMNDEQISFSKKANQEDLDEVAKALGVKITTKGDVIIIEGDPAEIDEAAGIIAQWPNKKDDRQFEELNDPYDDLEPGQRRSDKTDYLPDEYTVYDLVELNKDTGKWKCKTTTYLFSFNPYRVVNVIHGYEMVKPEYLIKLKKVKRQK